LRPTKKNSPEPIDLEGGERRGAASEVYGLEFEHAVCAAGVARTEDGFETAIENGD